MKLSILLLLVGGALANPAELKVNDPSILIVGHRGASGYRPEHTLASYELAIEQGADYIEPDLVMTKDGVLIARHENEISGTTDVEAKFPDRKKTKTIDGKQIRGWFSEDFTITEIKTLRARERLATRDQSYNGKYEVPTFEEVLDLAVRKSKEKGRPIGVYAETKHPTYFADEKLLLEPAIVKALASKGLNRTDAPVFIQSFELTNLFALKKLSPVRLIFLLDERGERPYDFVKNKDRRTYGDLLKPESLRELGQTIYGIGPYKRLILPESLLGSLQEPTSVVQDAHAAGLKVHPYTFRSDKAYLNRAYKENPEAEYLQFFALGIDGLFSDFPDHAVRAREKYQASRQKK